MPAILVGMKKRADILIAMIGLAFWWPFLRNSITGFVLTVPSSDALLRQSVFCVFMVVAAISCVIGSLLCSQRVGHQLVPRFSGLFPAAVVAVGIGTSVSSLLAVALEGDAHFVAQLVCAVIMAGAYVLLPVAWGSYIYERMRDVRGVLVLLLSSYALSFVIGYLSYLPEPFTYIRPVGAPAISAIAWYVCGVLARRNEGCQACGGFGPADTQQAKGAMRNLYGLTLVFFLVSSIATGFINTGSVAYVPSGSTLVRDTLALALAVCLLVAVAVLARPDRDPLLVRLHFLLIALLGVVLFGGVFIATFLGDELFAWGTGLMQASKSGFSLVLLELVLVRAGRDVSLRSLAHAMPLFVLPTLASSVISYVAVPLVVDAFGITYEGFWGTLSLTMGFALGVFLFVYLSSLAIRGAEPPVSAVSSDDGHTGWDPVLEAGLSHDLTAREQEILALLLKGNTYRKIAELLGVSENTVQFHAKNIYRKFDVHTKQQLIDCVEGYGA